MPKHPSHQTRSSDASTYDEVCTLCGAADVTGGGWGKLEEPCPNAVASNGVREFVDGYEFRADEGDHTPDAGERAMLEDAINGFLSVSEEERNDKIEGLEADLEAAVSVAFKRGAVTWTFSNYPVIYSRLVPAGEKRHADVPEINALLDAYFEAGNKEGLEGRQYDTPAGDAQEIRRMITAHIGNLIEERDRHRAKVPARALSTKALEEDLAAMEAIVKDIREDEENVGRFPEWVDERLGEITHEQKRRKMEADLVAHNRAAPKSPG